MANTEQVAMHDAPRPEDVKDAQRKHWNQVADGWAKWLAWTERSFSPLTDWFAEAAWTPGARVLDVACGPGYPAFAAAERVKPGGSVVATDISPAMVEAGSRRAAAAGIDNLEFRTMDAEQIEFGDESFDAVTNAYGLMFCPEPQRALREARRVLRPGGRVAIATWAEPSASPFFGIITGIAAPMLGLAPPDPSGPGPFRFSSPHGLESLLGACGFEDVRVHARPKTFEFGSADEYLQVFSDVAWKARIAALAPGDRARLRDAIADAVQPHVSGGRLRLVATSLCTSARRG